MYRRDARPRANGARAQHRRKPELLLSHARPRAPVTATTSAAALVPPQNLDSLALRAAFASFATGVTVITTLDEHGAPVGLTANSFGSVSLDPPLIQWSLRINSGLHRTFINATHFAVSVLRADQDHIAKQFASRAPERFQGVALVETPGESPLIANAIAHFHCKKINDYRVGDHELFIGEVLRANHFTGEALVFHESKFKRVVG